MDLDRLVINGVFNPNPRRKSRCQVSFLEGPVTFRRYKVQGQKPAQFSLRELSALADQTISKVRLPMSKDGVKYGWCAGSHVQDENFSHGKNVVEDLMIWGLVVESQKVPPEKFKTYYEIEMAALRKEFKTDRLTKKHKKEARENALARIQKEAEDGRFVRRQMAEVAWNKRTNEVYLGSTSTAFARRMAVLFKMSFGLDLKPIDSTFLMDGFCNGEDYLLEPTKFISTHTEDNAWGNDSLRNYLGNEFLLWLWHNCDWGVSEFICSDKSEIAVFFAKTLALDCPRGVTGREVIMADGPTRLPEARRAIQAGKLPRKAGFLLSRHGLQFEFTLQPELFLISSAKLPESEKKLDDDGRRQHRAEMLRELAQTVDLLYEVFCSQRLDGSWRATADQITRWLSDYEVAA